MGKKKVIAADAPPVAAKFGRKLFVKTGPNTKVRYKAGFEGEIPAEHHAIAEAAGVLVQPEPEPAPETPPAA